MDHWTCIAWVPQKHKTEYMIQAKQQKIIEKIFPLSTQKVFRLENLPGTRQS